MWRDMLDFLLFLCNLTLLVFATLILVSLWVLP